MKLFARDGNTPRTSVNALSPVKSTVGLTPSVLHVDSLVTLPQSGVSQGGQLVSLSTTHKLGERLHDII